MTPKKVVPSNQELLEESSKDRTGGWYLRGGGRICYIFAMNKEI